jgi:hypothetical protein
MVFPPQPSRCLAGFPLQLALLLTFYRKIRRVSRKFSQWYEAKCRKMRQSAAHDSVILLTLIWTWMLQIVVTFPTNHPIVIRP